MTLTPLQTKLCNILQNGLPITQKPFVRIAELLDADETVILGETKNLIGLGLVRRISATVNYRALGRISTLVNAHVEEQKLDSVVAAVNKLDGVSHNYLRDHFYNLWFTLQGNSEDQIDSILAGLSTSTGIAFHSLPALQTFKLDVRFDAESDGTSLLPCDEKILTAENTETTVVCLSENERTVLSKFQRNLEIVSEPFSDALGIIQNLIDKGVIRRIAAVVDYRKLGFTANAMLACEVENKRGTEVGRQLAASTNVSHCYHRRRFSGWPYNLFGMMHGRDVAQLEKIAAEFVSREKIKQFALLKTLKEFKKKPVSI